MDGPGTITWEEFLENAESFVLLSNQIHDGWEFVGDKEQPGQAYLCKIEKRFLSSDDTESPGVTDDDDWTENIRTNEDPFEAITTAEIPLTVEYHILWSMSYGVPVLYFNGWKSDFPGINPVTVEEAQKLVPGTELKYTELSQAIHPISARPFLQLHPCVSHELLQNTSKSKNKLVSWLSTVAPAALNLALRSEYCELTLRRMPSSSARQEIEDGSCDVGVDRCRS